MATYTISNEYWLLYAYTFSGVTRWNYASEAEDNADRVVPIPSPESLAVGDVIVFQVSRINSGTENYFGTTGTLGFSITSQAGFKQGELGYDIKLRCSEVTFTENYANEGVFTITSIEEPNEEEVEMGMGAAYTVHLT